MSTLRINNIEAQSIPASPTIDEKVKVTNSSGDILVNIDGKTSGITTIGINTTDGNIKFDANSNVLIAGILTATTLSGNFTPTSLEVGSNIKLGNAGVITATRFVGSVGTFTGDTAISGSLQVADTIQHEGDVNTKIRFPANDTITAETSGVERLRISSSGKVGIDMTNPDAYDKFVVSGTGNVIAARATSGAAGLGFYENNTGRFFIKSLNGSDGISFVDGDNSSERLRIASDGNIGMGGNTNPTNVLHIKTAVTNTAVATIESTATNSYPLLRLKNDAREYQLTCHGGLSDAFTIYDGTSAAHRFTITSAGYVGINQTSPVRPCLLYTSPSPRDRG